MAHPNNANRVDKYTTYISNSITASRRAKRCPVENK